MTKLFQILTVAFLLATGVSAVAEEVVERCGPSERCIPSPTVPRFDADYICRATSYSGRGYPLSYRIGDRYICQDLGYGYERRAWAGGNQTGRFVCCFDPYGY